MFASLKNSRMFAVPNTILMLRIGVFLCTANSVLAHNTGYQFPLIYTDSKNFVMVFGDTGGDSLSYIHLVTKNFRIKMPNTTKITNPANNSNGACTPNGAKTVTSQTGQNCGIVQSCHNCHIQIINGISKEQLQLLLKSVLSEFINSGIIDLKQSKL